MTPTPRTDAAEWTIEFGDEHTNDPIDVVPADFARQLERELTESKQLNQSSCCAYCGKVGPKGHAEKNQ